MKKILYIIAIALVLPFFNSCAGMLEEDNYGNPTIESMMGKEENVILLVGQAYADLKWVHDHWGYWGVSSLTSDECITPVRMPGEHWLDSYYWKRLHNHDWNWMGDAFKNIWILITQSVSRNTRIPIVSATISSATSLPTIRHSSGCTFSARTTSR